VTVLTRRCAESWHVLGTRCPLLDYWAQGEWTSSVSGQIRRPEGVAPQPGPPSSGRWWRLSQLGPLMNEAEESRSSRARGCLFRLTWRPPTVVKNTSVIGGSPVGERTRSRRLRATSVYTDWPARRRLS
jgi:hypothetical protein